MRAKKVERIVNQIVLSIKYARLKEEIADTRDKKSKLNEKKKYLGSPEKKIEQHEDFINKANLELKEIEKNNKPKKYTINLDEKLSLLSKRKNHQFIKYQIGLQVILDDTFEYTDNTNTDFVEMISTKLFNNKKVLYEIEAEYKNIKKQILFVPSKNLVDSASNATSQLISKVQVKDVLKVASSIPIKPSIILGGVVLGGFTLSQHFKRRKQLKEMTILGAGVLVEKLTIDGLNLLYAQKYYDNEMDVVNYRKYLFKEINLERSMISKELFEHSYDIKENIPKMQVLHNFDKYIMNQMTVKPKNRGEKNV